MKMFTIEEANAILPSVRSRLERIQRLYARLAEFREPAKAAAIASEFGGGMVDGPVYVKALYEVGKLTTELHDLGVQLKDYSRGLIDFPCLRDDRVVFLCWQLGDGDEIEWWHEVEGGFAGRQPL
ncbi:MAG: DUF2203 domain-containing protein [Pyrinomonadaceae bacterium]